MIGLSRSGVVLSALFFMFIRWTSGKLSAEAKPSSLEAELSSYRKRVEDMFYHAYNNYLNHAFPYDELRPLTCDGINTWGNFQVNKEL